MVPRLQEVGHTHSCEFYVYDNTHRVPYESLYKRVSLTSERLLYKPIFTHLFLGFKGSLKFLPPLFCVCVVYSFDFRGLRVKGMRSKQYPNRTRSKTRKVIYFNRIFY